MSESFIYLSELDDFTFIHIPFTPYFLVRKKDLKLWRVVEKQITTTEDIYVFRYL